MSNRSIVSYPLSPTQHGILVESLLAQEQHVYIEQMHVTLRGLLNPLVLREVFERAVERHEILRTWVQCEGGSEPVQVVEPQAQLPWEVYDWRRKPPERLHTDLEVLAYDERERGFDLNRAPLMKAAVIRTADDQTELLWTWHHILLDGWSAAQLLAELVV